MPLKGRLGIIQKPRQLEIRRITYYNWFALDTLSPKGFPQGLLREVLRALGKPRQFCTPRVYEA